MSFAQMDTSSQSAISTEPIFRMTLRGETTSTQVNEPMETEENQITPTTTSSDESKTILCALYQSGYLGAAYYTYPDSELYILNDTIDLKPDYIITKSFYNQIKPTHTITLGTRASKFVRALANVIQNSAFDESDDSNQPTEDLCQLPYQMELLKFSQYSYELCLHAVETLKLSCEPKEATDEERLIFLRSFLSFDKRVSIQALGALLIFLNNNINVLQTTGTKEHLYLNIHPVSLKNNVLINDNILEGLQIFKMKMHPSGQKMYSSADLSIFKLFNRCKSSVGVSNLKSLLLCPTNDITVLQKRHEFIEFCLKPINQGIVSSIEECLKNIFPIGALLQRIYRNQETINSWKRLHITLHNIMYVKQICEPYINSVEIFREFVGDVSDVVEFARQSITDTIDFENSNGRKVTVNIGVDELLDKKKRYRNTIQSKLNAASAIEINNVPMFVEECTIVYIPRMGYLVAIKKWAPDAKFEDLEAFGYRHVFTIGDAFNFKSAVCDELDKCLGDFHAEIEELEYRIIDQLGQEVMAHNAALQKPIKRIALFDSLICFAQVAKQLGYMRPKLVEENLIEIEDGRHALFDLGSGTNFIPNSFYSGGQHSVIKIITGPNNSGKSIFLKQTGLIVYLAHVGSYVPARSATIGMMSSLHCDFSDSFAVANELTSNMSGFASSLRQMSQANNTSNKNSLLLIDEFGLTSSELDGLSLLTSFLEHYLMREECCPHILVSTHYSRLTTLIPESSLVKHLKCDFKITEKDKIVFLHKITEGISNSYAKYTARNCGISEKLIERSEYIARCYREQILFKSINNDN